jgi:hypothetical protein
LRESDADTYNFTYFDSYSDSDREPELHTKRVQDL